ncbi:MAG: hypothetical protein IJ258_04395 [Methanobrevibacter sp.]|uniref:DUF5518 domain-containing protein n=1 Tax=Methanobrevibacter sp. TaxID=66852 RepID=UPI0025DCDAFB|nr:hypothetical protein [Methanobrevibacter sp.]MBQ8017329.1 hypothetical protein [Methanobrevibacter sp.]
MTEDIASNFELKPVIVGAVISIVCLLVGMSTGIGVIGILGLIIGSAISGFLTNNSTTHALIYGAIVGFVSSFLMFTVFSIPIFIIIGLFGGYIGKVVQNNY